MNPLAIAAGAAAAGFGLYKTLTKKPGAADFQVQNVVSASGVPVKVVTPIPKATTVAQRTGVSTTAPVASKAAVSQKTAGTSTVYTPPKAITQTAPGKFEPPPIIVTPSGAASVAIGSIVDVQRALNTLGFLPKLVDDGKLGPKTTANIRAFQSKAKLVVDGNAGPATKAALSNALVGMASGRPIQPPVYSPKSQTELGPYDTAPNRAPAKSVARPAPVKPAYSPKSQTELGPYDTASNRAVSTQVNTAADVQRALNRLGAKPPLVEDGNIGPKSVAAIKSFQMSRGLAADGVAGPKTKAALSAASAAIHGDYDMNGDDAVALAQGNFNPGTWC